MRDRFSTCLSKIAQKNKKVHIVVADISPAGKMDLFKKKNPNRFINVGVAEQTMIGLCAGLAMKGKIPFAYTISTFALYRPFEMIRSDLCYQNLPVTVVGMGAGTIYSTLGSTHLTQEDIAICRSIPNMQILAPADPDELEDCINYCVTKSKKPTYLRIGKSGERILKFKSKWVFGKIRKLAEGKKACLLFYGPIINLIFDEIKKIKKKKFSIYSCHTLKPFDKNGIKKIFKKYKDIIVLEDHSKIGGLSSIVKELAFESQYRGKIKSFGLSDKFMHCYGTQKDLLEAHNVSIPKIINYLKNI